MLTVNNITTSKNQRIIFKNLGFSAGLGSIILIKGKNGSGKTTLLKIICGLSDFDSGQILWNEENIHDFFADFSSDINYLGHKNFLKKDLTVLENLEFMASLNQTKILIPSAIKYWQLEEVLNYKIKELSSGWQKRILLSKLLCCPKTLWILDEPTVKLDEDSKKLFFNLVQNRAKDGGLVLIATHDEFLDPLGSKLSIEDFQK